MFTYIYCSLVLYAMNKTITVTHRPINTHQSLLLTTLYKFHYATIKLLVTAQQKTHSQVINARLNLLLEQGYIGRHYDGSYKLQGKEAIYFLLPKGIQFLRQQAFARPKVINALYHDKDRSMQHVQHCLLIFSVYVVLKHSSGDQLKFYSKSENHGRSYLPEKLPDALILFNDRVTGIKQSFFLECFIEQAAYRQNIARVKRLIAFAESNVWQNHMNSNNSPSILLVCDSNRLAQRIQRLFERELETSFLEIDFQSATLFDLANLFK